MKKIYRLVPVGLRERAAFMLRAGYYPQFSKPITYNQKVNYRKLYWKNSLFVTCSDKVAVKKYVAEKIGHEHIIDSVFVGDMITPAQAKQLMENYGSLVVKANHNSGPVQFLDPGDSEEAIQVVCQNIKDQLNEDYGKVKQEPWYSHVKPKVLVERKLHMMDGSDPCDYKFHVFNGRDGGRQTVILQMDYDRHKMLHRSFFNESLDWLPFSWKQPCLRTSIVRPPRYDRMLEIAKLLALPFSHARIDLYNIDGNIYFGEITFAHASGRGKFSSIIYDKWLGRLWELDPAI
ncbi:glycosyltransferase [Billgrantia diversa]|uniref:ATP-grasp fold amidoligase family protein n=1 Tax=Halomonas sp. MCCC 1A13316 TaxID=2733487 RepID=UPI0018A618E2|nr:ATP-grasp fold amidoligase family protein [Halomonas sp. MCCC 1A13316]QOR39290.1 glycosyltransferase [Halomonas sp. MCCC 1A13316]